MYEYEEDGEAYADPDARTWGMFCHLAALLGTFVLPTIGHFVGPLVVWLLKKDRSDFVDDQGREALNFQISVFIYGCILAVLIFISWLASAVMIGLPFLFLFIALSGLLGILDVVFVILAAVKANQGIRYRYPGTIRFL